MQHSVSLKSAERKAFQATFADRLRDVMISCVLFMFAIAPLLSENPGDFWSSAVFLPFRGLVYLAMRLTRRFLIAPRIGTVTYGKHRQKRLRKFSMLMVSANTVLFLLGIVALITGLGSGMT